MTAPIPLPWWSIVGVFAILLPYAYVLGTNRMSRYQDDRIDFTFQRAGRTATAVRYLYQLLDLPTPDLDGPKPEPTPTLWQRFVAWYFVGPPDDGFQPVPEVEPSSTTEASSSTVPVEPITPDSNPSTQPIVMPAPTGPTTEPAAAVTARSLEQILAEYREAKEGAK